MTLYYIFGRWYWERMELVLNDFWESSFCHSFSEQPCVHISSHIFASPVKKLQRWLSQRYLDTSGLCPLLSPRSQCPRRTAIDEKTELEAHSWSGITCMPDSSDFLFLSRPFNCKFQWVIMALCLFHFVATQPANHRVFCPLPVFKFINKILCHSPCRLSISPPITGHRVKEQ